MNATVLEQTKISELKSLVNEIEELEYIAPAFALTYEQQTRLENLRSQVNRLIKKL
jgi:hypothetical protein